MNIESMTVSQLEEALAKAKVDIPEEVKAGKKSDLVKFAKENLSEEPKKKDSDKKNDDPIDKIISMGFNDKIGVDRYLALLEKEKKEHVARLKQLEEREKELDQREETVMKKEDSAKKKAEELQEKLKEAQKQTDYWTKIRDEVKDLHPILRDNAR